MFCGCFDHDDEKVEAGSWAEGMDDGFDGVEER